MPFSLCIIQLYVAVFFGSEAREKCQWFKNHLHCRCIIQSHFTFHTFHTPILGGAS